MRYQLGQPDQSTSFIRLWPCAEESPLTVSARIIFRFPQETPGVELSDVAAIINPEKPDPLDDILKMNGVVKAQYLDRLGVKANGKQVTSYVMDDFATKETNTVYEGRYPLHDNEVAISGVFSQMEGLGIGNEIIIRIGENEASFLITGLTQGSSSLSGYHLSLRTDSVQRLYSEFRHTDLQIYLNDDADAGEFITVLENTYKDTVMSTLNLRDEMDRGAGAYITIVSKVGYVILVITIIVDFLVLFFMINSAVIRRRRELGTQKAIGFTTIQLMNQISLGFIFPITFGVAVGCLLGIMETNAIMSVTQRAMGIMKAGFIITPSLIALFGFGLIIVSYAFSMVLTYRIRNISAYVLVTE